MTGCGDGDGDENGNSNVDPNDPLGVMGNNF